MGATGKIKATPVSSSPIYQKEPSEDENNLDGYTTFTSNVANTEKWMENPKLTNAKDWKDNLLTKEEKNAIDYYTGHGYTSLNDAMYNTPWDEMGEYDKKKAAGVYEGLNKFELHKGINTVRQCDFQIFGAKEGQKMSVDEVVNFLKNKTDNGLIQVDGFLSSTTNPNGTFAHSHGLWIDIKTPPNKGGGAYVSYLHNNTSEAEYLHNSNSVFKFDPNSVKIGKQGYIQVSAEWVGQAKDQTHMTKKKNSKA